MLANVFGVIDSEGLVGEFDPQDVVKGDGGRRRCCYEGGGGLATADGYFGSGRKECLPGAPKEAKLHVRLVFFAVGSLDSQRLRRITKLQINAPFRTRFSESKTRDLTPSTLMTSGRPPREAGLP